jgi:tRNA A-37 threonylcarbamoyl transferase component Bud32
MNAANPQRLGKYEIVKTLGKGAMGVVYLAHDPIIDRQVAVKTIRKDVLDAAATSEVTARFRREAMAAGRLSHPGIVAVYDYGEDEDIAYIVMEYAPGEDLAHYAATRNLSVPEVFVLMAQLLDALDYAHRAGVVHRDIKPSNMLVAERLKITDFGIARIANSKLTQVGATMGTPAYMAPEQYMGIGVDHRADLFAAGVVCYELLTRTQPFDGRSIEELSYKICHTEPVPPTRVRPGLPEGVDAVLAQALAKTKEARFASAAEFARALGTVLSSRDSFAQGDTRGALGVAATVSAPPTPVTWSTETLRALEAVLAPEIGSIAGAAVRRSTGRTADPEQLVELLTETIDGAGTRAMLAPQLRAALAANQRASAASAAPFPAAQPTPVTPSSAPNITSVSAEALTRVTQVLAGYVGPIAKVMVKKAAADASSYPDLCNRLSERLGTEAEKTKFLRDLGVK